MCAALSSPKNVGLCSYHSISFLGMFAKLWKATVSFVMYVRPSVYLSVCLSVCLSVHMEHFSCH
jgi:hypothetical protein